MNKMHIYKWVILLQNMKNWETEGCPVILLISKKQRFATKDLLLKEVMQQGASASGQQLMLYNSVNKNTMHLATHAALYIKEGWLLFLFKLILESIGLYFLICNLSILTFTQATIYSPWRWWSRMHLQDAFF